jgi:hypothetical protein
MGLIRLLLLFLVVYLIFRIVRRLFQPEDRSKVQGTQQPPKKRRNFRDIEDADYEDLDK